MFDYKSIVGLLSIIISYEKKEKQKSDAVEEWLAPGLGKVEMRLGHTVVLGS